MLILRFTPNSDKVRGVGLKLTVALLLNVHYLLVIGQTTTNECGFSELKGETSKYLELVLDLMQKNERIQWEGAGWDFETFGVSSRQHIGITHVPSMDFNIYLTVRNPITPKITTSLDVSLNYAGVMNIRNLILLGKKNQKD